jgi:hypothetical protein
MDAPAARQDGGNRSEAGRGCLSAGQRHVNPNVNTSRIIVHFGLPKTGTTSIQHSLSRRLADARFHYVDFGDMDANYAVATAFKADPHKRRHLKRGTLPDELPLLRERILRKLRAELDAAGGRTAVLSAEIISSLKEAELRDLHAVLANSGAEVTAAGYARRPKEAMESLFQQQVRSGRDAFGMNRLFPGYRSRIQKLDTVLGRKSVQVWLFDPASFPGQCVVRDFCSRLEIAFQPKDVIRANRGLSRPALALLYAYRRFGPGYGAGQRMQGENRRLIRRLRDLAGPKARLHSSLVAPILEKRREVIQWMEDRLEASLAEDLTAHDDGAIRSENDLLEFSPESLRWLAEALGPQFAGRWRPDPTPGEVAEWMHLLRGKVADAGPGRATVSSRRASAA